MEMDLGKIVKISDINTNKKQNSKTKLYKIKDKKNVGDYLSIGFKSNSNLYNECSIEVKDKTQNRK